jgi:hypothetical protein
MERSATIEGFLTLRILRIVPALARAGDETILISLPTAAILLGGRDTPYHHVSGLD